jgi:hypothetical protein
MGCALPEAGEPGVELLPARVVVSDKIAGVTVHDAQSGEGGLGPIG